tara:strand:+ start:126 stop:1223 length:1098 start_codon:yes stop_codon:yes gene_type:complete
MQTKDTVQEKCLIEISKYSRCSAAISMGVGKTRIAIKDMQSNYHKDIKVLVAVPKLSIIKSWSEELKKLNLERYEDNITYTTYRSINKVNNNYDIVYLDECHNVLPSHLPFLDKHKGRIIGLTGTPIKDTLSVKYHMHQKFFPVKYVFTVDDATDSNILNDYRVIIHELNLSELTTHKKKKKNGGQWFTSEVNDYMYHTKRVDEANPGKQKQFASILRMKALMSYTTKDKYVKSLLNRISSKCIVFANTHEQADKLCKHSYHSSNKNSEDNLKLFSEGTIKTLSCVLQLSEGVTIPDLKQGIIMHSYGNERKSAQRIGRLLRLNPDDTAICHILCYKGTKDEEWLNQALKNFNSHKIEYYNELEN